MIKIEKRSDSEALNSLYIRAENLRKQHARLFANLQTVEDHLDQVNSAVSEILFDLGASGAAVVDIESATISTDSADIKTKESKQKIIDTRYINDINIIKKVKEQ